MALREDGLHEILLQLPTSLRDRAEEMASHEHLSLNLFVAVAIAEKLQRLQLQECLGSAEQTQLPLSSLPGDLALVH